MVLLYNPVLTPFGNEPQNFCNTLLNSYLRGFIYSTIKNMLFTFWVLPPSQIGGIGGTIPPPPLHQISQLWKPCPVLMRLHLETPLETHFWGLYHWCISISSDLCIVLLVFSERVSLTFPSIYYTVCSVLLPFYTLLWWVVEGFNFSKLLLFLLLKLFKNGT